MFSEFGDDHLGQQSGPGDAATYRARRNRGCDHAVAAVRTGVLGQNVDLKLEVGGDKVQHPRLILADACLGLAALRANLLGLGHVVLDAHLRQSIVIGLARAAWLCGWPGLAGSRLRRQGGKLGFIQLEQMPLSGGFHQPLPPRTKDIAAVKLELMTQLGDRLLVLLDDLVVQLRGMIEGGLEILDMLGEPTQQVVTLAGISGPGVWISHQRDYIMIIPHFKREAVDFRLPESAADNACVAAPSGGRCRRG